MNLKEFERASTLMLLNLFFLQKVQNTMGRNYARNSKIKHSISNRMHSYSNLSSTNEGKCRGEKLAEIPSADLRNGLLLQPA